MSESPPEPQPAQQPEPPPASEPARPRWRQRTWSLPVVVAVALVAVLLGGLGGAALASVGDHQDGRRGPGFGRGPGGPGFGGPGMGGQRGPGGQVRPFGNSGPNQP